MVDSSTFMCYIKSNDDEILPNFPDTVPWNSKKWRMLLFFSDYNAYTLCREKVEKQTKLCIESESVCDKHKMEAPRMESPKIDDYYDFLEENETALNERMQHMSDTFQEYLFYLIESKGLTNAEVYKRAIIIKQTFSKIKLNPQYHPDKSTAMRLCVGAKLSLDETIDLLARAGYALSPCDKTDIIFSFFIEKALQIGDVVSLVVPKSLINAPEFGGTRKIMNHLPITNIVDFGEKGFDGVLVETIAIFINSNTLSSKTRVISTTKHLNIEQEQKYICSKDFPYWIIYRNAFFDTICKQLEFDKFSVFRDRQITNSILNSVDGIRVIKSRNINDSGTEILNISNYDSYIDKSKISKLSVSKFLNADNVFLTPNMTYNPRVIRKPKNCLVNGSVAILIPKDNKKITDKQLLYFSTKEYRQFYQIARNFQTRSLNVDAYSVYFFGLKKQTKKTSKEVENVDRTGDY